MKTCGSDALRSLHSAAKGLETVGAIDQATMTRFDLACLTPIEGLSPTHIKCLRETANISQALFARASNVTASLVSKWERGETKPSGTALKLLTLIERMRIESIL